MNREKAQIVEGIVSVVVNAVLFAVKFWVGLATGSIALVADAWHTMSDSLTSIFVVLAAKLASKKPDKEHPFGHGRWELIASLLIAFVLVFIGYEFIMGSIERFQNKVEVTYGTVALVVTIVSIILKEALAQYGFYIGRKTNNPVVTADGWHSRSDALSSVVVLIGMLVSKLSFDLWWMDSVLGVFCALAIIYAAIMILKEAITRILGEEPDAEFIAKLDEEVSKVYKDDLCIHHVHLHNYISQKELTLHIRLNKDMTIYDGHEIATVIENIIEEKFDMVATIHVEPLVQKQE
ncbi:MAG: cation diffusion facilitator family transporter [Oscillospiraceae bacterium]|nr:cation diffusion facilitator family transporter [Oscillospiraceae bacterium]